MKVEERLPVMAEQIARSHHERWDGSGYVEQLQGDDIPARGADLLRGRCL